MAKQQNEIERDIFAELNELKRQATVTRVTRRPTDAEIVTAAEKGEALVIIRQVKSNGRVYRSGEHIHLEPGDKILTANWVTPLSWHERNATYMATSKFLQNTVEPIEQRLHKLNDRRNVAMATYARLQAELRAAQDELQISDSNYQQEKQALADALANRPAGVAA